MMAKYLLRQEKRDAENHVVRNPLVRLQKRFEEAFERLHAVYRRLLELCLHHRRVFLITFFVSCLGSLVILIPWWGRDFFPLAFSIVLVYLLIVVNIQSSGDEFDAWWSLIENRHRRVPRT
jgi:multidrug efflux pump subunit AcrB